MDLTNGYVPVESLPDHASIRHMDPNANPGLPSLLHGRHGLGGRAVVLLPYFLVPRLMQRDF
jgi:hypothetical protein